MSRQPQTESSYVPTVTVRNGDCLCPDLPRQKVHMSSLSCVQKFEFVLRAFKDKYVQVVPDQKLIRPYFCVFLSRPSCVHQTFVLSCLEFCIQTLVLSFVFPDHVSFIPRCPIVRSFWFGHIWLRSGTSTCVTSLSIWNPLYDSINFSAKIFNWKRNIH